MPVQVKYQEIKGITVSSAPKPNVTYRMEIKEYSGSSACQNTGNEFRPLAETDALHRLNPYQDPERGRIKNQKSGSTGKITNVIDNNVELNLCGPDSIVGRAVVFWDHATDTVNADTGLYKNSGTFLGCCVIGWDIKPNKDLVPHHHHNYAYPESPENLHYHHYGAGNAGEPNIHNTYHFGDSHPYSSPINRFTGFGY